MNSSLTIADAVFALPGAQLQLARNVHLRFEGPLYAAPTSLFMGEGKVSFSGATPWSYPEWWGARANDADYDSIDALEKAIFANGSVALQAGDYYLSRGWTISRPFSRVWGAGAFTTRLILDSDQGDVLTLGLDNRPATVNDFVQGLDIRWLSLTRKHGASIHGAGLVGRYLLDAHLEGLRSLEHATGFLMEGMVHSFLRDCVSFRSLDAGARGLWRGFWTPGLADIGLAGANASLFLEDCNATIGGQPKIDDPVGLLLEGAFADTFVTRFETAGVATGIRVAGNAAALGGRAKVGHTNLHIVSPILDQCSSFGIEITQTSDHALIDLSHPYIAMAPLGKAAIYFNNTRGSCSISGGQLVGRDTILREAVGLLAINCTYLQLDGLKILDFPRGIVLDQVEGCRLAGLVNNIIRSATASVSISNSSSVNCMLQVGGNKNYSRSGFLGGNNKNINII